MIKNLPLKKLAVTLALSSILLTKSAAFAQQTIISVPSSDVLPTGDIILKESNRFNPFNDHEYLQLTPTIILGTGFGTETSVGVATKMQPGKRAGVKMDIATKKVFFLGPQTRFTVGGRISPELNSGRNPDTLLYAHGTYRIKKTRTSLTSGVYVAGKNEAPNKAGVILGIDQVIIPNKLRFAMDYMSRNESWGAIGVGLKYRPVPDLSITSAVILPNGNENNFGFNISFSKYIGNISDIIPKEPINNEEPEELQEPINTAPTVIAPTKEKSL